MFDSQTVQKIAELGVQSQRARVFTDQSLPNGTYFVVDGKGEISERTVMVPRRYECATIPSFVAAVTKYANPESVLLLGRGKMVCVIDGDEHAKEDDRIAYNFSLCEAHNRLVPMVEKGMGMTQSDLVLLLRTAWKDCVDSGLLPIIRGISFSKSEEGERTIEHGQDSVSNSIKQRVASKGSAIPESFYVEYSPCPHVCDYLFKQEIVLDIDVDRAMFRLYPDKDQFNESMEYLMAYIHETMRTKLPNVTMFSGKEM